MTDTPASARPPLEGGPAPPPKKKSLVGRLAAGIAGHPFLALAAIIVLTLLVIGLCVYYRGLFFLGPYAAPPKGGRGKKKERGGADAAEEPQGDPETERLIDSINQH